MSDKSLAAINFILQNEGGFSDDPKDSGGATNFGISLRFLRSISDEKLRKYGIFKLAKDLDSDAIKYLIEEQAIAIYEGEFWNQARFDQINLMKICNYIFDTCVNVGINHGIKILQRAIWTANKTRDFNNIIDDGILGPETLEETNYPGNSSPEFEIALCAERAGYYRLLAAVNPKDKIFLNGWLDRAYRI